MLLNVVAFGEEDIELTHTMWHCALHIYYLDGTVCGCEDEVGIGNYRRVQAGVAAWKRVGGVKWDRKLRTTERKSWKYVLYQHVYKDWVHGHRQILGSRRQLAQENK